MAITQEQFDTLVNRLEREAALDPAGYKIKLGAFATLGYLYILCVLLALLATGVVFVAVLIASKTAFLLKLALPIFVLIGLVLKSLWVKLDAPQGWRLERREHPVLFQTIDEIRRATGAPRAHIVLLTNDLNAAVVQVSRLGMFGWQKNHLILGLPLMQLLPVDEFKAVLAHEFGHLSGAHGRFGAWIYRLRSTWSRLNETLRQEDHWASFLFVPFFNWYAPKFAAYSFVQARRQEYEADQLAAASYGAAPLANALVRFDVKSQDLTQSYWPSILAAVEQSPTPSELPYRGLLDPERRGFLPQAPEQLRQALQRETSTADTHPCLRDRIAALHIPAAIPSPFAVSAAEALFGGKLAAVVEHFDTEWRTAVAESWRARHEHIRNSRVKLAGYAERPAAELTEDERYEYAVLLEQFDDASKAFDIYKALVDGDARPHAKFAYGRLLLQRGDESGIRMIEDVMMEVPESIMPGCDNIVGFLRAHGREAEAQPYIERYLNKQQAILEGRRAREAIRTGDVYLPHTLSSESLNVLKQVLIGNTEVSAAYLVRKQTPEGEPPLHIVGVLRKWMMWQAGYKTVYSLLINKLATELNIPEEVVFIWVNGNQKGFKKVFNKIAGSRIR